LLRMLRVQSICVKSVVVGRPPLRGHMTTV